MNRTLQRVAFGVSLLLVLKFHLGHILDPWQYDGDARQHVFWTYRFADPELFPNDLLVRFISSPRFDPPGYVALYAVGARLMDALLFSKVLAAALCLVVGLFAWRIGRRLGGEITGVLSVAAVSFLYGDLRGGLPRSFAFPLVLFFLDGLVHRRRLVCGLAFVAAALFYPPLIVSLAALTPLLLLDGWRLRLAPWRSLVFGVGAPALLAGGILASSYFVVEKDLAGPMVTRAEAYAMPEFHHGGRNEFWTSGSVTFRLGSWSLDLADVTSREFAAGVAFYLGDWSYSRSACGFFQDPVFWPFVATLVLLLVRRRRFTASRELKWMLGTSALLFVAAHLVLFKLFLPSRYTIYTWPVAMLLLVAVNLAGLAGPQIERVLGLFRGWRGVVVLVLLLVLVIGGRVGRRHRPPSPERIHLYETIAALPKDVVLAGLPSDLDSIPLRTRRSVLVNAELSLPYYKNYYAQIRERTEASLRMLLARDRETLLALAGRHGVTHLLVKRDLYDLVRRGRPAGAAPPFDQLLRTLAAAPGEPILASGEHGFPILHEDPQNLLLDLGRR